MAKKIMTALMVSIFTLGDITSFIEKSGKQNISLAQDIGSMTVGAVISAVEKSINRIIDNAIDKTFDRVDQSIMSARSQSDAVIASASNSMRSIIDKTVNSLQGQERDLFNFYNSLLKSTELSVQESLDRGTEFAINIGQIAASQNPFGRTPTLLGMKLSDPYFYGQSQFTNIRIIGLNLGRPDNTLSINGTEFRPINVLSNSLEYRVNLPSIDRSQGGVKAVLRLMGENFFGIGNQQQIPLFIRAIDDYLGDISILFQAPTYPEITRNWPNDRDMSRECHNERIFDPFDQCTINLPHPPSPISVTPGYRIKLDSVRFLNINFRYDRNNRSCAEDERHSIFAINDNSFNHSVWCRCPRGLGRVCGVRYRLQWQEISLNPQYIQQYTETKRFLRSNGGLSFTLPPNTQPLGMKIINPRTGEERPAALGESLTGFMIQHQAGSPIVEVIRRRN